MCIRNVQVTTVRIKRAEKSGAVRYDDNVTVGMPIDEDTNAVYLRIAVDKKTIISVELDNFQWLDDSCADGVVTLDSSSMQIIIIYDKTDRRLRDFFAEMNEHLSQDPTEKAINDLVQSIRDGSSKRAGQAAEHLAEKRLKVQFKLLNRDDHDVKDERERGKSTAEASAEVLELQLQVESHLNKDPLLETIYVRSGTKLCELKEQIENETGINKKDQYWLAFEQYIIHDDYEFGSDKPVVPSRPVNAPKNQPLSPKEPIRSGDKLIMCIAQLPPFH
jgi:hypothetical protein